MKRNQELPLQALDVSCFSFGPIGAVELARFLSSGAGNLRVLHMNENSIGDVLLQELANGIDTCTGVCSIEELDLYESDFCVVGATALGRILKSSKQKFITLHLNFAGDLGDESAIAIAEGLKHNTGSEGQAINRGVKRLNLAGNKIGDKGAMALFQALAEGRNVLELLEMHANEIGNSGAAACKAILSSKRLRLKELSLGHNITDKTLLEDIDFYLRLNKVGPFRELLSRNDAPDSLWAHVLAKAKYDRSVMYYVVREKAGLFEFVAQHTRKQKLEQHAATQQSFVEATRSYPPHVGDCFVPHPSRYGRGAPSTQCGHRHANVHNRDHLPTVKPYCRPTYPNEREIFVKVDGSDPATGGLDLQSRQGSK